MSVSAGMSAIGPDGPPFIAIIPARLASTRLPEKPLADICGKPMVVRVAERAAASGASQVLVATDSGRIVEVCREHNVAVMLTRPDHASGTDRLAEVAIRLDLDDYTIVVNLQGDEPLIEPGLVSAVARHLGLHPDCAIATAAHAIVAGADVFNPNVVKVVLDARDRALYFSRAPIPWVRGVYGSGAAPAAVSTHGLTAYRHIGLYAYRSRYLKTYAALAPAPIEQAESLEQLRALWHGERIAVLLTPQAPAGGVDTAEDLARVRLAWPDSVA